jgi:hypothetical protein
MENPTLATHTPVAIALMSLFPFQMAMLAIVHERLSREGSHIASNAGQDVLADHNQK